MFGTNGSSLFSSKPSWVKECLKLINRIDSGCSKSGVCWMKIVGDNDKL